MSKNGACDPEIFELYDLIKSKIGGDEMTFDKIQEAVMYNRHLYVDDSEVKVVFLDKLTEVIEVKFIKDNKVSVVTEASLSLKKRFDRIMRIGDGLIWRVGEENV